MNISESVQHIMSRHDLVTDLFYIKFLDGYPDVRKYFEGIDLDQQAVVLKMALPVIEQYHRHGYPAAEQYLKVLGHRHEIRGVPPELYADWRDCLLDTLEQFHGQDWNDSLENEWTEAINLATDVMCQGYDEWPRHGEVVIEGLRAPRNKESDR